jgi:hypothetical protein
MAKSRRIKRSRKSRRLTKRRLSKRSMAKRRLTKRSMAKRGGLTCYDEKGWPDRNGYYTSNGQINDDCPIKEDDYGTSDRDNEEDSWGNRRGY